MQNRVFSIDISIHYLPKFTDSYLLNNILKFKILIYSEGDKEGVCVWTCSGLLCGLYCDRCAGTWFRDHCWYVFKYISMKWIIDMQFLLFFASTAHFFQVIYITTHFNLILGESCGFRRRLWMCKWHSLKNLIWHTQLTFTTVTNATAPVAESTKVEIRCSLRLTDQ